MPLTRSELKQLVDLLGEDGARAGLDRSHYSVKDLRAVATELAIETSAKITRKDVVAAIVNKVNQRIEKPISELLAMSSDELLGYFDAVRPSKVELLAILNDLDFHPGSEAQKGLYKYAARQIAETGMFQRVAKNS